MVANRYIIPDIDLRINFHVFSNFHMVADISKCTDKNLFSQVWLFWKYKRFLDAESC